MEKNNQIELITKYKETKSDTYFIQLYELNKNFIHWYVQTNYSKHPQLIDDMISECKIGFIIALNNFDSKKLKGSFQHYLTFYLKDSCIKCLTKNVNTITAFNSKPSRKILSELVKNGYKPLSKEVKQSILDKYPGQISLNGIHDVENIAKTFFVSESLEYGDDGNAIFVDIYDSIPSNYLEPYEEIEQENLNNYNLQLLQKELDNLSEREYNVISQRWLNESPKTLQELGKEYGISAERVRQLEQNAFRKIRNNTFKNNEVIQWNN